MTVESLHFQFPLWDFFECNMGVDWKDKEWDEISGSQFPLWDFFECNVMIIKCWGIEVMQSSQFPLWDFFECNSLLKRFRLRRVPFTRSQFPLWDFFECNQVRSQGRDSQPGGLSIPFVGFLRMQRFRKGHIDAILITPLSIPFVGFLRMQHGLQRLKSPSFSKTSQFPLWDFFECNNTYARNERNTKRGKLSIPFVGFLRMQPVKQALRRSNTHSQLSIPFVGFLRMQPPPVCPLSHSAIVIVSSQFPLWDFFECNPSLIRLSFRELGG